MAGVHIEAVKLGDAGKKIFLTRPSPSVILRFNSVGLEMLLMQEQEQGANKVSNSLEALAKKLAAKNKSTPPFTVACST
jgi:hypothetical protein